MNVRGARPGAGDPTAVVAPSSLGGHLREGVLLASLYVAYSFTRTVGAQDVESARQRADDVLRLEGAVHLDIESRLNATVTDLAWLAVPMDYWYAVLHYVVTPVALVWLYLRQRSRYTRCRNAIVIASVLALIGYLLFPTAPPRLMGQPYLDTLAHYAHVGWWTEHASAPSGLGELTNELAAMPSLHVGWAVWVTWALYSHVRSTLGRAVLVSYPLLTTAVVVCTGNHWLLDCIVGILVVVAGIAVAGLIARGTGTPGLNKLLGATRRLPFQSRGPATRTPDAQTDPCRVTSGRGPSSGTSPSGRGQTNVRAARHRASLRTRHPLRPTDASTSRARGPEVSRVTNRESTRVRNAVGRRQITSVRRSLSIHCSNLWTTRSASK